MDGQTSFNREAHLNLEHWNNIPESASLTFISNSSRTDKNRQKILRTKIVPCLKELFSELLTPRQFQVINLCLIEKQYTQTETAKILGITQPTVHQHLKGKIREGKRIGGAYRRIRKKGYAYIKNNNSYRNDIDALTLLDLLFKTSTF